MIGVREGECPRFFFLSLVFFCFCCCCWLLLLDPVVIVVVYFGSCSTRGTYGHDDDGDNLMEKKIPSPIPQPPFLVVDDADGRSPAR